MKEYKFEVSYSPTPKSDAEQWYTVQAGDTIEEAEQDMEYRYPPEKGYTFIPCYIPDNAEIIRE